MNAARRLKVYYGPEHETATGAAGKHRSTPQTVTVALAEVLPLLADAVNSRRTWLRHAVSLRLLEISCSEARPHVGAVRSACSCAAPARQPAPLPCDSDITAATRRDILGPASLGLLRAALGAGRGTSLRWCVKR